MWHNTEDLIKSLNLDLGLGLPIKTSHLSGHPVYKLEKIKQKPAKKIDQVDSENKDMG